MKSFAALTVAGVAGLIMFKFLAALVLPALALLFGLVVLTVKFALVAAVGFFIYSMLKKSTEHTAV